MPSKTADFPEKILRGIPNDSFVSDGFALPHLFKFDGPFQSRVVKEMSINWNDDEYAKDHMLNQKKRGSEELQFKYGVAIIPREKIDEIIKTNPFAQTIGLCYERQALNDNKYHGNLLVNSSVKKQFTDMIQATIAIYAQIEKR